MKTRNSKILMIGVMLTLSMLFAGCAPTTEPQVVEQIVEQTVVVVEEVEVLITPEPEPPEPVVLTYWHAYNEVETELLETEVIPLFEEANPGVTVELLNVPYDDFRRKLLVALTGGSPPDLMRGDIAWITEFAHMGALEPLDEFMSDFDSYAEAVFPGPLSTNLLKGHYYGLPLDTNTRVLTYNTGMFADAGIAGPPETIDDFLAACEKIEAFDAELYCFADGGTYGWAVNPWIWSMGSDIVDPSWTTAIGYLDGPGTQATYEFLKDLLDKGYMHPGIVEGGLDVWGAFGNGEVGMILEGPWFPPYYSGEAEYGFALMPAGDGGHISVVGGEDIAVFRQSQNKEEAVDFIRFMLTEEIQLTMAQVGQIPVLTSALESDYVVNHEFFGYFLEQLQYSMARLPHPNWTKIEDVYNKAGAEYLLGLKSFEEALGAAAITIDGLLVLEE